MFNIYDEPEMPNEGFVRYMVNWNRHVNGATFRLSFNIFGKGGWGRGRGGHQYYYFKLEIMAPFSMSISFFFGGGGGGHYYYLFFFRRGERGLAPLLLFRVSIRKNNGSKIHFHFFIIGGGIVSVAQQIDGSILHFHFVIFGGGVVLLVQNSGSILHVHFMLFQRGRREGGGG